jgi:predicted nucleic-acid-binding protein
LNHIDSNALLRVALGDVPKEKEIVLRVISNSKVKVPDLALIEVAFVLERYYKLTRVDIQLIFNTLGEVGGLVFDRQTIRSALDLYVDNPKLGLEDCVLVTEAEQDNASLLTFDKTLAKQVANAKLLV